MKSYNKRKELRKYFCGSLILIFFMLLSGCTSDNYDKYIPANANEMAPDQVSDVQVEAIPGGARISYVLPKSDNLLYVIASYERNDGEQVETKTAYYDNDLIVEGFSNTDEHTISLRTVTRGGLTSEPLEVNIQPLTPAYVNIFESLSPRATFGGVSFSFLNDAKADVSISVLGKDETAESGTGFSILDILYTKAEEGVYAVRGLDTIENKFGLNVRDRWGNTSDTLFVDLKPLYEEMVDNRQVTPFTLPSDYVQAHTAFGFKSVEGAFDGVAGSQDGTTMFHTRPGSGLMPQWFTFDMGVPWVLSRFKYFRRPSDPFSGAAIKKFEIYGSNNPNLDGSWDSWTLVGTFETKIPSGEETPTAEDNDIAVSRGQDFEFPEGLEAYRYYRWKTLETFGNLDYIYISELQFWGSKRN